MQALLDADAVVVAMPDPETGLCPIEIKGKLASLIGGEAFPQCRILGMVVAEEGVEPPTPGL
jgi:hypothetical protein